MFGGQEREEGGGKGGSQKQLRVMKGKKEQGREEGKEGENRSGQKLKKQVSKYCKMFP